MKKWLFGILLIVSMSNRCVWADALDTWTAVAKSPYGPFSKVVYGNGRFVAISPIIQSDYTTNNGGGLSTSTDGIHWTTIPSLSVPSGVAFGQGVFVTTLWDHNTDGDSGFALSSTNGLANMVTNPATQVFSGLYGLTLGTNASSQATFVAVGHFYEGNSDTIITSTDGQNWTARTSPKGTNFITSVAYNPNASLPFLAVGYTYDSSTTPTLLWSSDSTTWTTYPTNISRLPFIPMSLNCVNGIWYADNITSNSYFFSGTNVAYATASSRIFTNTSVPFPSIWVPRGAAGGLYISVNSGTTLYTSPDRTNWTARSTGITNKMTCIGFGQNYFIIGCADGTLYRSGDVAGTLTAKTDPTTKFPLLTIKGGLYTSGTIQVSTNLTNWSSLAALTNYGGTNTYLDTTATNNIPRYYRTFSQ